ncbi:chitinase-3-like protein [Anticarsia gemmatalis]|uniref:chitinase-3-like protein n=1 Tax=Anticarsia gemmatalis TaxID=129554 RepID=UPI003F770058
MWEKMKKEERNNKFQRLRENEKRIAVETVENNMKYTNVKLHSAHGWRVAGISACLLFAFIVIMCLSQLSKINSITYKSVWRTSAHVHVYTYTHLARIAPHALRTAALADLSDLSDLTDTRLPDPSSDKVVSCYYNLPNESDEHQLMPNSIHPYLCTHINVAFARIFNKEITLDDSQVRSLQDVVKLKQHNPNLKILLSVGGAGNDRGFSDMVVNHASRKVFIKSIKRILRNYTLDGVDLDWEFPALHNVQVGGRERQHFSQLLREIRMEYIRERRDYLLTIAAAAPETIVNISYDIDQVNQYVDYVNIMTYDYHFYTKFTPFTGFNSPLYARSTEHMYLATLNINYTVHMYMDKGLDPNKIVVGIPTYGHTFKLVNPNNPRVGSPASGFGSIGGGGFVNYPDICSFISNVSNVNVKEDSDAKVPYMYKDYEWVSYDTPQSVREKAKFIKDKKLRGAMIYSLNADDYAGRCTAGLAHDTRFPLAESVKNTLIYNGTEASQPDGRED